jgi:hypothetical protein
LTDDVVEIWATAEEYLAGRRQRAWLTTRLDRANVVQVSADGVNIAIVFSRLGRDGRVQSQDEALPLVTPRAGAWKIQAPSSMGVQCPALHS